MRSQFTLEYWRDGKFFVGRLFEVPGVFSQGNTLAELKENIQDAYDVKHAIDVHAERDMHMNFPSLGAVVAPALCAILLPAVREQPPDKPKTDLGAPGNEHKILDTLAGVWDVTVRFPVGPGKHMEGKSNCEAKWVFDGRFLRQEYSSTFRGKPLTVVRYLGFDRHKGKYVEVHFESTHTEVMHSEGAIDKDGKTITCLRKHIDAATGKEMKVRSVTTIQDKDAFKLEMIYLDGEGKEAKTITLTHKRKKPQ